MLLRPVKTNTMKYLFSIHSMQGIESKQSHTIKEKEQAHNTMQAGKQAKTVSAR